MATTETSTLKMTGLRVDGQSVTIFFSEPVDVTAFPGADSASALNPSNYSVFAPNSGFNQVTLSGWAASPLPDGRAVVLTAPTGTTTPAFAPGDWVQISIAPGAPGIALASAAGTPALTSGSISGRVPSTPEREVRDIEDTIAYPVLTEEVAYRPSSPVGIPTTGAGGIAGPGASNIGQIAMQAVTDVLGWKVNPADPKGFLGALTQSFSLKDVEGHVESSWVPRTYAVQTDLGGGITGAQASLYMRAKDALDQSLSLLDGLYPLDPDADPEYVRALREMARSQMNEIVKEFGVVGLPSILRINTYFKILLGQDITQLPASGVQLDPDQIGGTLGDIRKEYGIYFEGNPFNNSVEDEQDITNFRVISDYMTSLSQSWIVNRRFFEIESKQPAFFGTQLVLIARQFNVITETVNEVRFALDSVFIGPNERQTLLLRFPDGCKFPSMYLEDILDEVDSFVGDEGPRLLRDGGKISVTNNIRPVVKDLKEMIDLTRKNQDKDTPKGFKTARVRRAMDDLHGQLDQLLKLTKQVEQILPTPLTDVVISSISATENTEIEEGESWTISIFGNAFDPAAEVAIYSVSAAPIALDIEYFSAQRIDVTFDPTDSSGTPPNPLEAGSHDIEVTNPDGQFAILSPAFTWTPPITGGPSGSITPASTQRSSREPRKRFTMISIDGTDPWAAGNAQSSPPSQAPANTTPAAQQNPPAQPAAPNPPANLGQAVAKLQSSHEALSKQLETTSKEAAVALATKLEEAKQSHAQALEAATSTLKQGFSDEIKALEGKLVALFTKPKENSNP